MTTVKFSATPTTLIESQNTVLTFRFELDQAPPASGVKVTVKGNVPQSLNQLDLLSLSFVGGEQPVGDFDFSGFDFTITSRVATIRLPIFQDNQTEGLQAVTYTLQPGSGYTVDRNARGATVQFADTPAQLRNIRGTAAADTLTGTNGKNTISGLAGNDRLSGLGGNDTLIGGAGNDTLIGGRGSDTLRGNQGRDVFVLEKGPGTDRITDFTDNQDRLGLSAGITFGQLNISQRGNNVLLKVGNDALATLSGVQQNQINQADFVNFS
jgi:hypothetical protein